MPLTEEEFCKRVATNESDDESDWDEIEEVDTKEFFATTTTKKSSPPKINVQVKSTNNKTLSPLIDIGMDHLFSNSYAKTTNSSTNEKKTTNDSFLPSDDDLDEFLNGNKENSSFLSESGKLVKNHIKDSAQQQKLSEIDRVFEKKIFQPQIKSSPPQSQTVKSSTSSQPPSASSSSSSSKLSLQKSLQHVDKTGGYFVALPTNIRVSEPKFSMETWLGRSSHRKCVQILEMPTFYQECLRKEKQQQSSSKKRSINAETDWFTVGVLASRPECKTARDGKTFSMWCLTDLRPNHTLGSGKQDDMRTMRLFLFGAVHDRWWKETEGSVFAILNPEFLPQRDTVSSGAVASSKSKMDTLAITVNKESDILTLGSSPDFGTCSGTTKAGNKCNKIINKDISRYCDYHVKSGYTNSLVGRPGFKSTGLPTFGSSAADKKSKSSSSGFLSSMPNPSRYANQSSLVVLNEIAPSGRRLDSIPSNGSGNCLDPTNRVALQSLVRSSSFGSMNLRKHLEDCKKASSTVECSSASSSTPNTPSSTSTRSSATNSFTNFFSKYQQESTPPVIGGGFLRNKRNSSTLIDLDREEEEMLNPQKLRAIAMIRAHGGVAAMKAAERTKHLESIDKRIKLNEKSAKQQPCNKTKTSTTTTTTPAEAKLSLIEKKCKMSADEMKRLLSTRSAHTDLADEADQQEENKMFDQLEKREQLEEHLLKLHEQKVKIVYCKVCKFKSLQISVKCKEARHPVVRTDGTRRFFKCKDCHQRTTTLERYPVLPCKKCKGMSFEKTGMREERKGPALPGEVLRICEDDGENLNET